MPGKRVLPAVYPAGFCCTACSPAGAAQPAGGSESFQKLWVRVLLLLTPKPKAGIHCTALG